MKSKKTKMAKSELLVLLESLEDNLEFHIGSSHSDTCDIEEKLLQRLQKEIKIQRKNENTTRS